ncbi:ABC transporter ATP-binding protein [Klebsiella pneumoniae subsp. ozaenae]|uniref:ABC transporter ATP-binding protein n=1 Tax=Klebsiella pneumoniae subsp. ozaenae TaxID=574 RepID=A0A377ZDK9_KLEPO|nr:ABC transporter ATP-binding protein [Klebsiella pneumoniae subsp. ozaenae]
MLVSSNVTMQFGSKPLFENISVKFGGGNRYGLIGANGSGKSTFMKILGGDLEPTLGNVSLDPNERIGKLRQDQFAFEAFTVAGYGHHGPRRAVGSEAGARSHLRPR